MKDFKSLDIGILYGGWSAEREISIKSGDTVFNCLLENGYKAKLIDLVSEEIATKEKTYEGIDLAFILVHGRGGEDGFLQNFLDKINIPYTGSNALSSKLGMNKISTKRIWQRSNICSPNFVEFNNNFEEILNLSKKVVVKPASEGSSYGISIIENNLASLKNAIEEAKKFDEEILIEEYVEGNELTVSIIGNHAYSPLEIIPNSDYYDFDAKYNQKDTIYKKAALEEKREIFLKKEAIKCFEAIGCSGWGRIDLIDDGSDFYFLELNTVPGMTEKSLVPKSANLDNESLILILEKIIKKAIA
ncbi:MAG: D-alanine--D-alanine ligase [Gammaproteobacteria bacterium]|nr:D-alanine--D-alanine ligase [Gammaproteobacteria bacterium]